MTTYLERVADLDRRIIEAHDNLRTRQSELREQLAAGHPTDAVEHVIDAIEVAIDSMEEYREVLVAAIKRGGAANSNKV